MGQSHSLFQTGRMLESISGLYVNQTQLNSWMEAYLRYISLYIKSMHILNILINAQNSWQYASWKMFPFVRMYTRTVDGCWWANYLFPKHKI